MSDKIYFQWQNSDLRKTIYPVREMKLRHFLLYYYEIDLWAQYKDKQDWSVDKFPKEKAEFLAAQKKAITAAYSTEGSLKTYFRNPVPEVVPKPGYEDNQDVATINTALKNLRINFAAFYKVDDGESKQDAGADAGSKTGTPLKEDVDLQRSRDRREKIFVTMRMSEAENTLKGLKRNLARKKTLMDYGNAHNNDTTKLTDEWELLEKLVVPRMQEEVDKLKEFVAAQNKLEKRKHEYSKRVSMKLTEREEILKNLLPKRQELKKWETRRQQLGRELLRATKNPGVDEILQALTKNDIYASIRAYLAEARIDTTLIDMVIGHVQEALDDKALNFYKEFLAQVDQWREKNKASTKADPSWLVKWVNGQASRFLDGRKKLDKIITILESKIKSRQVVAAQTQDNQQREALSREIGTIRQVIGILADSKMRNSLDEQWEKFDQLQHALRLAFPTKGAVPNRSSADVKSDMRIAVKKYLEGKADAAELETQLTEVEDALCIKREKYLKELVLERELTLKDDILPFLSEKYYAQLAQFDHDELLRMVFQRFWAEPERYPLWLQYMVIHFSGMRYASAHGSWADPRDLLLSLRTRDIQEQIEKEVTDIKTAGLLEASCEARYEIYEPLKKPLDAATASSLPQDARAAAQDYRFIKRFQGYYKDQLSSPIESKRFKAYLDLRVDEEGCEIQAMRDEDVLEELKELHEERHFPDWMWKEIVKLTDLRLTEVESENWETLTAAEQAERLAVKDKQLAHYREILNKWKSDNLTGWREEHERSNRLIVTRAVCNEVAEHIQHLRGHVSAAGLTQKPFWYKGAEDRYFEAKKKAGRAAEPADAKPEPRPYFVRAKDRGDEHHTFEVGASILWLRFVNDSPNEWRIAHPMTTREGDDLIDERYCGRTLDSGNWAYVMGKPISRSRQKRDQKGKLIGSKETQYLRWMHEATVATVADTAEGKVVLTFETALPYEDPSLATIGVFRRYLKDLNHDLGEDAYNPAFVGFMPEKSLSVEDVTSLEEMLDWNHIFLKEVVSPSQLEAYREKYIRNHKPTPTTVTFVRDVEEARMQPVAALKPLKEYEQWIDGLAANPQSNLYRVKKWGDLRPGELDVNVIGTSNFQAVSVYNDKTGFGAVSNYLYIPRDHVDRLRRMQVDDVYDKKHEDWRSQKMNWLCRYRGSIYMYDKVRDSWTRSAHIRWGTLALGGNLVQVRDIRQVKMKGKKKPVEMALLAAFRKWDWDRPLDELLAEGLVHRCFCAYRNNRFGDSPQGIVYSPFYSVLDWDFGGRDKPREVYLPMEDIYKPELIVPETPVTGPQS